MATMQEVADLAGVSLSTVSYAITRKRPVSQATRERIEAAMRALDFTPNSAARALAARRSHVLAVAYPAFGLTIGATINSIVAGAAARAREDGYNLVLWPVSSHDPDTISALAAGRSADGVLLLEVSLDDPRVAAVEAQGIPCGLIGRTADPEGRAWSDIDWEATMHRAVEHLASQGHREIALIGRDEGAVLSGYGPAVRGIESYRKAMARHGLEPFATTCDLSPVAGHLTVQELMRERPATTGIIVMNELALFGATAALRESGYQTPRDVSLVAVAIDTEIAEMFEPSLTHLRPRGDQVGRRAVKDLLTILQGEPAPPGTAFPCELIQGATTSPATGAPVRHDLE